MSFTIVNRKSLNSYQLHSDLCEKIHNYAKDICSSLAGRIMRQYRMRMDPLDDPTTRDQKAILLIHGLNQTPYCFYHMRQKLQKEGYAVYTVSIDYKQKNFERIMKKKVRALLKSQRSLALIGHSLGGNLAARIATKMKIDQVITINSPLRGAKLVNACTKKMLSPHLVKHLDPTSSKVKRLIDNVKTVVHTQFYHLYAQDDFVLNDKETAFFDSFKYGAIVREHGHISILEDDQTISLIASWLKI